MKHFLVYSLPAFSVACLILFFSLWHSSALEYKFAPTPAPSFSQMKTLSPLSYTLPQVGQINAASPLWPVRAVVEKVSYVFSGNHLTQAQKALFFADERLANAQMLFSQNKNDLAVATLVKAEKYLELASGNEKLARKAGIDTREFVLTLAQASDAHKQVIEHMILTCSSEARPLVVKTGDYPKLLSEQLKTDPFVYPSGL